MRKINKNFIKLSFFALMFGTTLSFLLLFFQNIINWLPQPFGISITMGLSLLAFAISGSKSIYYFKEWQADWDVDKTINHIKTNHPKILNYGLAKIHVEEMTRSHYYDALEIITSGYEQISKRNTTSYGPITITLFYNGSFSDYREFVEKNKIEQDTQLDKLYQHWKSLVDKEVDVNNHKRKYILRRAFICKLKEIRKNDKIMEKYIADEVWYGQEFKGIDAVPIDCHHQEIRKYIEELGEDLDFAAFEGAGEHNVVYLGFFNGRITYLLLSTDHDRGRGNILRTVNDEWMRLKTSDQDLTPKF